MSITITWDLTKDAEIVRNYRAGNDHLVRSGTVKGLTNSTTTPPKALVDAIMSSGTIPPDYPDDRITATLSVVIARGHPQSPQMAQVWAHYETPGNGGTPIERFAAEDNTTLVNEPTRRSRATGKPLYLSTDTAAGATPTVATLDPDDKRTQLVTTNTPRTWRSIVLYGLFADRPTEI